MAYPAQVAFLAVEVFVIGLRIYVRWLDVGPGNWQLDDYLMPLIGVAAGSHIWMGWFVASKLGGLTNANLSDERRATLSDTNPAEYTTRQLASKVLIAVWSLSAFIIWALKVCLAVSYSRITARLRNLKLQVRLSYFFIGVTYVAVQVTILFSCRPISKLWQINPDPGNMCHPSSSRAFIWVYFVLHIVTDLHLLCIPLPLLWKVNIGQRKKIILMSLFSGGIFTMVATVIRTTTLLGVNAADMGLWSCLEIFIAISVTNAPVLHPLLRRWAHKLVSKNTSRHNQLSSVISTQNNPLRSNYAVTTLGSDEYASTDGDNQRQNDFITPCPLRGVVVDREVSITTEVVRTAEIGFPVSHQDWDITAPKRPLGSYWSVRIGAKT
ncbi:hypothetical protein F4820DRAFT_464370 [Hypoxylon rubiginosum]|uniref:Uncharacterized protein n=1 Tax=Hypoxylon rubiginosum TaxID=110542 RepID=A0ACB9YSA5_9PEZI|nr:hypothetical protein F4820DRAFT_464370 [Hypoxylon rubiginosum]